MESICIGFECAPRIFRRAALEKKRILASFLLGFIIGNFSANKPQRIFDRHKHHDNVPTSASVTDVMLYFAVVEPRTVYNKIAVLRRSLFVGVALPEFKVWDNSHWGLLALVTVEIFKQWLLFCLEANIQDFCFCADVVLQIAVGVVNIVVNQ
jgi:hypothetical protein